MDFANSFRILFEFFSNSFLNVAYVFEILFELFDVFLGFAATLVWLNLLTEDADAEEPGTPAARGGRGAAPEKDATH